MSYSGFPCGSAGIEKAELPRADVFELWCWRRLFESPFGLLGDPTSPSLRKSVLNIHWKD